MVGDAVQRARAFLNDTQNDDGGWGYRIGSQSVTEATALAVIAHPSPTTWEKGVNWLLRTQREDGGWGIHGQDDAANWLTAWATWALLLSATTESLQAARRGVNWLLDVPVVRITDSSETPDVMGILGIDPTLAGWPWQPGEASFVEPTALSLLVLAAAGMTGHPRFAEGVAYLRDRVCQRGGWNVGNPFMFQKPLPPTPYNTALALLALRETGAAREEPVVRDGLAALGDMLLYLRLRASSVAWGLAAIQAWSAETNGVHDRLLRQQVDDGGWGNSPYATASALFAMQEPAEEVFGRLSTGSKPTNQGRRVGWPETADTGKEDT